MKVITQEPEAYDNMSRNNEDFALFGFSRACNCKCQLVSSVNSDARPSRVNVSKSLTVTRTSRQSRASVWTTGDNDRDTARRVRAACAREVCCRPSAAQSVRARCYIQLYARGPRAEPEAAQCTRLGMLNSRGAT
jgi:hypothetical protein